MQYWLVKSEPNTFSWNHLVRDKKTDWDGVRNYQARNNLMKMKEGDQVLFYHSFDKEVVGISQVTKEAFPDPTSPDGRWVAVELIPLQKLDKPVGLEKIKEMDNLQDIALVKQTRLSVMPLSEQEYYTILELGKPLVSVE